MFYHSQYLQRGKDISSTKIELAIAPKLDRTAKPIRILINADENFIYANTAVIFLNIIS